MSFLELLFPTGELENLRKEWPSPGNHNSKKRRSDSDHSIDELFPRKHQKIAIAPANLRRNTISLFPAATKATPTATAKASATSPRQSCLSSCSTKPAIQQRHSQSVLQSTSTKTTTTTTTTTTTKPPSDDALTSTSSRQPTNTGRKSCLPTFIEPSILKCYLSHLHPNDRSRYSIESDPKPHTNSAQSTTPTLTGDLSIKESNKQSGSENEAGTGTGSDSTTTNNNNHDTANSPPSMIEDNSSSPESDNCPTPTPGIYEQLRTGPFAHVFDGLRCTAHERHLMEGLLGPAREPPPPAAAVSSPHTSVDNPHHHHHRGPRPTAPSHPAFDGIYRMDGSLLRRMFPQEETPLLHMDKHGLVGSERETWTDDLDDLDDDDDVHSSGLSPAAEAEVEAEAERKDDDAHETEPVDPDRPVLSTRGIVISMDDFFDLDEASD